MAENLFLRKQLALFQERQVRSKRTSAAFRLVMVGVGKLFDWRGALVIVKPETFLKWHRTRFELSGVGNRVSAAVRRCRNICAK